MKVSVKFVTVWRRDLRYPVLTDFLPFSKHSIQHRAQVAEIAFFHPLNDWKVLFFSFKTERNWWFHPYVQSNLRTRATVLRYKGLFVFIQEKQLE